MADKQVPELRFKGFTEDWELCKLGEILSVNSGRDYKHLESGDIPVYGTGGYMLSVNDKLSDVDAIGIGRKGTIDKPQYLSAPFWTVDTLFYLIPEKENDLLFLFSLIKTINWKQLDESTGVPSLSKTVIQKVLTNIPKETEQKKLGKFFKILDDTITLHHHKLELLKQAKQGFLQQMFPKEGENVPELRFANFSTEWEQRKLGEVATIVGGGTPNTEISEYWNGEIDWYSPAELGNEIYVSKSQRKITDLGLQKSSATILPIGTVLFTSRAGIGNTAILEKEAATNQGFQSIIPLNGKLDTYFIYSKTNELKKYGEINGAGSTFIEISGKQMKKMPLYLPEINEQQAIGQFFKQIDDTITLYQQKLTDLEVLKQAYLQKMFI